jgi:hypothetical protein
MGEVRAPVVPTVPVGLGWVENYVPVLIRLEFHDLPTCSLNARQFNDFLESEELRLCKVPTTGHCQHSHVTIERERALVGVTRLGKHAAHVAAASRPRARRSAQRAQHLAQSHRKNRQKNICIQGGSWGVSMTEMSGRN